MKVEPILERIYPDQMDTLQLASRHCLNLHLERYEFAARYCTGPRVADIACGCGYGTSLMASRHPDLHFIGIDCDQSAVEYARQHYPKANVHYFCASLLDRACVDQFDMVVSLQTIGYLPDPSRVFVALADWVKPGGRLVVSTAVSPMMDRYPNHLADFTARTFKSHLVKAGFQIGAELRQVQPWSLTYAKSPGRTNKVLTQLFKYYKRYPWHIVKRLWGLGRYGFRNHYLTVVGHKI